MPPPLSTIKRLSYARIECTVAVSPEEAGETEKGVLLRAAQTLNIDGFRPGHAPENLVRQRMGEDTLQKEMARTISMHHIPLLIEEHKLFPIIPPTITISNGNPLVLTFVFVEKPRVTVKRIKSVEKKEQTVEDSEVEKIIENILKQQTVKESPPPTLTDDLAKTLGSSSAQSLRADVKQSLLNQKQRKEQERQEQELLSHIADATEVELAPELIAEEVRSLSDELMARLKSANLTLADWFTHTKKREEDLWKDLESQALDRLKLRLGIEHLIAEKNVKVADETIAQEIRQYLDYLPPEAREDAEKKLTKGEEDYARLHWRLTVNALIENLLR